MLDELLRVLKSINKIFLSKLSFSFKGLAVAVDIIKLVELDKVNILLDTFEIAFMVDLFNHRVKELVVTHAKKGQTPGCVDCLLEGQFLTFKLGNKMVCQRE